MNATQAKVLIVDDDADIRTNIADILDDLGYQTSTADNGFTALEIIRQHPIDVVLFDYKMPGMDGASLYQEIKKLRPSVAAIMITAWAGSDGAQKARNAGTWDVLDKPVNIPDLLQRLSRAVNAPVVLIVDDDKDFCQSLWQILNERHFRVALAHTEDEGITQANLAQCQIAIVDLKLGSGDGRNVIRMIEKAVPNARTVIVSGDKEFAALTSQEFRGRPISAVCEKPIVVDQLLSLIESETHRN